MLTPRSLLWSLSVVLTVFVGPTRASAQVAGPEPCGQEARGADYGSLRVGAVVVLQRHRFVGGDPNWDARMARYVGRPARVTRLSGVDDQGCPGVRVQADGGRWFWRVRDVTVGAGHPRRRLTRRRPAALPQDCDVPLGRADYGPVAPGQMVVLGRHRPVRDDAAWSDTMTAYVGRTARVVELSGTDAMGCPVVRVDGDGRQHLWRVRDLSLANGETVGYRPGLASDHGRPRLGAAAREPADPRLPQACGLSDDEARYAPVSVGSAVIVTRHRPYDGVTNWSEEMDVYVGLEAEVVELIGVDEQGCPGVRLDIDQRAWFWRLRDLRLRDSDVRAQGR
ncbi:MAG: hypothetical protein AB8I08_07330 [Sandaracinaceae bacterium]